MDNINRYRTLVFLLTATVISYLVSQESPISWAGGIGALALAWFKGRLVILDFMELRHAPNIWRISFEGGLGIVTLILMVIYLNSPAAG